MLRSAPSFIVKSLDSIQAGQPADELESEVLNFKEDPVTLARLIADSEA